MSLPCGCDPSSVGGTGESIIMNKQIAGWCLDRTVPGERLGWVLSQRLCVGLLVNERRGRKERCLGARWDRRGAAGGASVPQQRHTPTSASRQAVAGIADQADGGKDGVACSTVPVGLLACMLVALLLSGWVCGGVRVGARWRGQQPAGLASAPSGFNKAANIQNIQLTAEAVQSAFRQAPQTTSQPLAAHAHLSIAAVVAAQGPAPLALDADVGISCGALVTARVSQLAGPLGVLFVVVWGRGGVSQQGWFGSVSEGGTSAAPTASPASHRLLSSLGTVAAVY